MGQRLVFDASAGVEFLGRSFAGRRLAQEMESPDTTVWTVEHFYVEVAKVVRRDVLDGTLTEAKAAERIARLAGWQLYVARVAPLLVEAWELRHNVTVHDALYVVLARQLGATLITGDRKLAKAPGLDVEVRTVP
jgi:predicted nucleic acid-binding protein